MLRSFVDCFLIHFSSNFDAQNVQKYASSNEKTLFVSKHRLTNCTSFLDHCWCQLGSTWPPKFTKIYKKSVPRSLPKLRSFFNRFLIDFWCQLQPPEPSKSLFFLRKISFSKTHPSKLASIFDAIWVPTWLQIPSKIQQNPVKSSPKRHSKIA